MDDHYQKCLKTAATCLTCSYYQLFFIWIPFDYEEFADIDSGYISS